jgi:hypothetical protein
MCDDKQPTKGDTMTDDPDFNPVEDALARSQLCLLVPTECPDDPDIIGPFTSYEEAKIWSQTFPGAEVRKMASPEYVVLDRLEHDEVEALKNCITDQRASPPLPDRRPHWRAHISPFIGLRARDPW